MLNAIIIDDELNCTEVLQYELNRLSDTVHILAMYNDPEIALVKLPAFDVDIVFLDIEMPGLNAFQLLDRLESIDFQIIFTTAYDHYALKAFRYYAVDYLLKPIDKDELSSAVDRVAHQKRVWEKRMLSEIHSKINAPNTIFTKITLPTQTGYVFAEISEIVRCEANSNYATIFLDGESKIIISKPLKHVQELLQGHGFFRCHQSHLVNLNFIKKYEKNQGGYIVMKNGDKIGVSQGKKSAFEALLKSGLR
ncbi:LytR/AlgR family response regulator transcription factor [Portibacter lacus]|uniref:DNA-binding response regulator n=1 Tax=Portibacter lacus TaxID=1099794 RepID=A0AA37SL83_9BACT|nr:LytTR family DNA-binding domain-containing protein [Portibacter lacus]GLR16052.1 DNA-binding response regulator [Portibacter lacus]